MQKGALIGWPGHLYLKPVENMDLMKNVLVGLKLCTVAPMPQ